MKVLKCFLKKYIREENYKGRGLPGLWGFILYVSGELLNAAWMDITVFCISPLVFVGFELRA
jgi:hypothetical protein